MDISRDFKALFPGPLLRWYAGRKRDLPWRRTKDPYRIWISEVMLQQTTVAAVIPYYRRWLSAFPNVVSLAQAPLRDVLKAWEGLGYYQRARNLRRTAGLIVRNYAGRFPREPEALAALPGFGPYTTAAVASICFALPLPVIEANIRRVMMRMLGIRGRSGPEVESRILHILQKGISRRSPGNFNQAMMEWGALVCRPRNPLCPRCPGRTRCRAYARGEQEIIPARRTLGTCEISAVVAVLRHGRRVLIQKRPEGGLLGGLWEFPGGKVESGESLRSALIRELREELGLEIESIRPLITVRQAYTRYKVTLHAFEAQPGGGPGAIRPGNRSVRWVTVKALDRYPFPSGSLKILRLLQSR